MELHFTCPVHHRHFISADWEIIGRLRVEEDASGQRRLAGEVRVFCPHCGERHVFAPDKLACPLTAGTGTATQQGGKG